MKTRGRCVDSDDDKGENADEWANRVPTYVGSGWTDGAVRIDGEGEAEQPKRST